MREWLHWAGEGNQHKGGGAKSRGHLTQSHNKGHTSPHRTQQPPKTLYCHNFVHRTRKFPTRMTESWHMLLSLWTLVSPYFVICNFFDINHSGHPFSFSLGVANVLPIKSIRKCFDKTVLSHLKGVAFFHFLENSEFGQSRFWKDSDNMHYLIQKSPLTAEKKTFICIFLSYYVNVFVRLFKKHNCTRCENDSSLAFIAIFKKALKFVPVDKHRNCTILY